MDFREYSVTDLAAQVRSGKSSARELVTHALDVIERLNPRLNAFRIVDRDAALKEAGAVDQRVAAGDLLPLAGIPIGVKDVEDAYGYTTTSGSATRANDPAADRDSVQVARLKAAGCVVVGKTNTPEFGLKPQTDSPAFGITRNPWDTSKTPGGSSGGTSSAIASGMVPLATGSDGGGSIRIPSAVTGLSGLKPSLGRVPDGDPRPTGWQMLSTRGPIARRVRDVAAALDVIVGPHPRDIRSLPAKTESWAEALRSPVVPKRAAWCPTLGYADVDDEVRSVCEQAVTQLESLGTEIVEIDRVWDTDPGLYVGHLVSSFTLRTIEPYLGTEWESKMDPLVVISARIAQATVNALGVVRAYDACHMVNLALQDVLDGVDVLLSPTVTGQTAPCEAMTTVAELMAQLGGIDAIDVSDLPSGFIEETLASLSTMGEFNFPRGTVNGELVLDWTRATQPFNLTRSPAGTVNAGFTGAGMPVGLQVVGQQHGDLGVLHTIASLEDALGLTDRLAPL